MEAPVTLKQRLHYIDHLRGFMFVVMAFDHALHAYAQNWGRFWFFRDYSRTEIFDAVYLFDQSIIMPMLFFIFGMFVIPSLARRGVPGFFKEKFIRLGIPFLIGIPLIVPLLAYPKYEHFIQPGIGYLDFWYLFLTERIQAGPNWVMYAIFLYSAVMVLAYKAIRPVFNLMACFVTWATRNPVPGFITVGAISATILGISDLIWGAPWWMGKWVFHLQSSRFILVAFFFTLGAAFAQAGLADNKKFMEAFSDKWILWVGLVALFGIPYMWYSTTFYHEGAFNEDIRIFFSRGGSWGPEAWDIIFDAAPPILIRTTMHGFMCLSQALALLAVFYKFVATPTPMWTSLARNCYGIFIIHEAVMVWSQYMLTGSGLPIPLKFAFVFIVGLSVAWTVNDKVLLKIPLVKRVLSPNG